jgi:hypothetical protein
MHDTCLHDDLAAPRGAIRRSLRPLGQRRAFHSIAVAAAVAVAASVPSQAQLPGAPVLQNAWATPGVVGAVDIASGSAGSVYAAAASWAPGAARFQLSAGAGFETRTGADSRWVYGGRVAVPLLGATSSFGIGLFAGIGGGPVSRPVQTRTFPAAPLLDAPTDSVASTTEFPVGAAIGWRHAVGATHGLSLYATPSYVFFSGGTKTGGLVRTAIGGDLGITRSIGATLGVEFGQSRSRAVGGPSAALYGLGLSYAFGRR